MGEEGQVGKFLPQRLHSRKPGDHRRDHDAVQAFLARQLRLHAQLIEVAGQAGDVASRMAGGPHPSRDAGGAGADSVRERAVVLIGQSVVVLDEIQTAARETFRQQ